MSSTSIAPSQIPKFYPEILYFFMVVIIPANAVIIVAFSSNHIIRNNQANKFLCMNAVIDLLVGILFIPCLLAEISPRVLGGMIMYSLLVSLFILTGSTFDRYIAICKPLRYEAIQTDKLVTQILLLSWFFPGLVAILPQFWLTNNRKSFTSMEHRIYLGIVTFSILVIVAGLILVYVRIFQVGFKHLREQLMLREYDRWTIRAKKEIKFGRMFCMLSLTFAVFWLPTGYMTLVENVFLKDKPPLWLQEINFYWIFSSSFLNPIICIVVHTKFRKVIIHLFKNCRNPSAVVHPMLQNPSTTQRHRFRISTTTESF